MSIFSSNSDFTLNNYTPKVIEMKKDKLYDYIFHYNHHKDVWSAIKRGNGNWEKYINGEEFEGYRMKSNVTNLINYILKYT